LALLADSQVFACLITRDLLNHFPVGQGPCLINVHKWSLATTAVCGYGHQHTVIHQHNPKADCRHFMRWKMIQSA